MRSSALEAFHNTSELSDKDMSRIKLSIVDNAQGDEDDLFIYDVVTTLELPLLVFPYRSLSCSA